MGARAFTYTSLLQPLGETVTGLYDGTLTRTYADSGMIGRPTGFTLGSEYAVGYGYDVTGRFDTVTWTIGTATGNVAYSRVPASDLLAGLTYAAGPAVASTYEPNRNLKTVLAASYGGSTLSEYRYQYDALGRRSSVANLGQAFQQPAFSKYGYNERQNSWTLGASSASMSTT